MIHFLPDYSLRTGASGPDNYSGDARRRSQTDADYSGIFRNRSALLMTETELKVIAALAITGLSSSPKKG